MPGDDNDYQRPLPWLTDKSGADERCLSVDSTQDRFDEFTKTFADPATWVKRGHVVLVTGERGYGKTSLVRRCAAWLADQAARTGRCRLVPVDLSDERWPRDLTAGDRMQRTLDRMLEEMGPLLREGEAADILGRTDPFHALGRVLDSRLDSDGLPVVLMVLLEGYPVATEILDYYYLAEKGMFFFAEVYEREQWARVTSDRSRFNRNGADFRSLHVDEVDRDDLREFAEWLKEKRSDLPQISGSFLSKVAEESFLVQMGARSFLDAMWGALRIAMARGAPSVTEMHLLAYFEELSRMA